MLKDFRDKKHRPITFQDVLEEEAEAERKRQEEAERPVREAEQRLVETHRKLATVGRDEVVNGQPDPWWETPADALNISLGLDESIEFVREQSRMFRAANLWYLPCQENFDSIVNYLVAQRVPVPTLSCFELAASRLRSLGLLKERPAEPEPSSAPVVEPQTETETQQEDLVDGFDESGNPIRVTQAALWKMSSAQLKTFYRMWTDKDGTDRRPRFNRSRYA